MTMTTIPAPMVVRNSYGDYLWDKIAHSLVVATPGRWVEFTEGRHFDCKIESFHSALHRGFPHRLRVVRNKRLGKVWAKLR